MRELVEKDGKLFMKLGAGKGSELIPYVGPAVFRNMKADKTTIVASEAKPAKGKWAQNTVQVSVDAEGSKATPKYSIQGEKLGCSVDASGEVKIGDKPGTITVRAGNAKNYDEVTITITAAGRSRRGCSGREEPRYGSHGRGRRARRRAVAVRAPTMGNHRDDES